jgi:hypothetical protein
MNEIILNIEFNWHQNRNRQKHSLHIHGKGDERDPLLFDKLFIK